MMKYLILAFALGCSSLQAHRIPANEPAQKIFLSGSIQPPSMIFISRKDPGPFALSLNIPYSPIKDLRLLIEKSIGRNLDFLKSWDPQGEAHVTVITPPEFSNVLGKYLSADDIESIARKNKIQSADLLILGIGSGKKEINGNIEETFFVLVDSQKLRQIRHEVWKLFIQKGGDPKAWDPTWFFPHITIGYTKQDLHEPEVIKNLRSSWDQRFNLVSTDH